MRAVWLEEGRLTVRDLPPPTPGPGEAVVRLLQAGICNTDLELRNGYAGFTGIPGHESVGVVEAGPEALVGRRVVGEINVVCGRCLECTAGRSSHCRVRTVVGIRERDGAFAELLALPVDNLHVVPDGVSDDAAVFIEPLAAALRVHDQVRFAHGAAVLVVGAGKLGQLIARSLAWAGAQVTAVCRNASAAGRLQTLGIRTCGPDEAGADGWDIAVECTGNPGGVEIALAALRPRGTLVLKSTYRGALEFDSAAVVVDEIQLVGSRCGRFEPALDLLASGEVDPTDLIEARYPLREVERAFEHAARPGALKVLLQPD